VFAETSYNITLTANYLHIGSYIGTIVAYDPNFKQLVQDYSIVSQNFNGMVSKSQVFSIESASGKEFNFIILKFVSYRLNFSFFLNKTKGIIYLNDAPMLGNFELVISAKSFAGYIAFQKIYITLVANYKTSNILIVPNVNLIFVLSFRRPNFGLFHGKSRDFT
jgi:hypothetical protein